MQQHDAHLSRRDLLKSLVALALAPYPGRGFAEATPLPMLKGTIPATGEQLPIIGMGTWITFDVGTDPKRQRDRAEVLRAFFEMGGTVVDSSPMYGSSQAVIGYCLKAMPGKEPLFSATKVWTWLDSGAAAQMQESARLWGVDRFDLMQIHNLVSWRSHLETLRAYKAEGRVRYVGITTSHGRRHDDMESIMATQPIDFVQFTYNILDRKAEQRLLPIAAERGLAVIVNRPFRGGDLFDYFARHPLPEWTTEFDCTNWAQFFLKFAVSHPAVSCAIPATSRVDHMRENMGALYGRLPDEEMRERMIRYVESI
jgi:diketogulonate reductase-like aldo/keto reductase